MANSEALYFSRIIVSQISDKAQAQTFLLRKFLNHPEQLPFFEALHLSWVIMSQITDKDQAQWLNNDLNL